MYLSKGQIEKIGEKVVAGYQRFLNKPMSRVDIENMAEEYFGLKKQYAKLSDNGELLGLTTFQDVDIEIMDNDKTEKLSFSKNVIILDESLKKDKSPGRKNFTVAHECAHQILYRMELNKINRNYQNRYVFGCAYIYRKNNNKK